MHDVFEAVFICVIIQKRLLISNRI
jgi:hypothetical protein